MLYKKIVTCAKTVGTGWFTTAGRHFAICGLNGMILRYIIEMGLMSAKDPEFAKRMFERRIEKARLDGTIAGLERRMIRSANRVTPEIVEKSGVMVAAKPYGTDPMLHKSSVQSFVDRVKVDARKSGSLGQNRLLNMPYLTYRSQPGECPVLTENGAPGRTRTSTDFSIRF